MTKEIILLRGISGSGKSTIASTMVGQGVIFSTDDFFMVNGFYEFNPANLGVNHEANISRTQVAMEKSICPIIIDNTNINAWEMKPYVLLADTYGYQVKIVNTEIPELEELMRRQALRANLGKSLPEAVVIRMIHAYKQNYNVSLEDIRNSIRPF